MRLTGLGSERILHGGRGQLLARVGGDALAEQDTIMVTELAVELKVTRAIATGPRITVPDS